MIRKTVRVLLLKPSNELLLMKVQFSNNSLKYINGTPRDKPYWITLGGKIEEGENIQDAARREIYEETGIIDLEIGPIVWIEETHYLFNDIPTQCLNTYIVMKTKTTALSFQNFTKDEKKYVQDMRWFSYDDIQDSGEDIHPLNPYLFKTALKDILDGKYPEHPIIFKPYNFYS